MIKPEQIPDEVVDALWRDGYDFGDGLPSRKMQIIRDAIAAALNAWPGMHSGPSPADARRKSIILPLTENSDA